MKKVLKQAILLRLSLLLLSLTLLLSATILPVGAASNDYVGWNLDGESDTLTAFFPEDDSVVVYHRYEDHPRLRFAPISDFLYHNEVEYRGVTYSVRSGTRGGDTVVLEDDEGNIRIYVTETGKKELDTLLTDTEPTYSIIFYQEGSFLRYRNMDNKFHKQLRSICKDTDTETKTETLYDLRYAPRFEVCAYSADGFMNANSGMLFDLAGELYYTDVFDLPSSAFDENGALTPSKDVSVTLYRLPEEMETDTYADLYNAYTYYGYSVYESRASASLDDDDASNFLIYFAVIVLGLLLPVAPFVLGLCLPHSHKQRYKKRWYLLTLLAAIWMLLGILLLVLMIVAL